MRSEIPTATVAHPSAWRDERVAVHADIVKSEGESRRLREFQHEATSRRDSRRDKKSKPES
jgi:hypothetical protein